MGFLYFASRGFSVAFLQFFTNFEHIIYKKKFGETQLTLLVRDEKSRQFPSLSLLLVISQFPGAHAL